MTTDDVLDEAARFVRSFMSDLIWRFDGLFDSPIEEMFAASLLWADVLAPEKQRINLVKRDVVYGEIEDMISEGILCWPQASVGKYRTDFLLCQRLRGETRWLAVECDGHAFHDATKAQVAKGKKRDRFFASIGLPIIHFSGSEINANPLWCAMEALEVLWPVSENG